MKIVLASLAGSVGKTSLTAHCLFPRMENPKVYSVDSTNITANHFDGIECEEHTGEEFARLYKSFIRVQGDVIIDVGGSKEAREFLEGMAHIDGHDEVDFFIVPAKSESKDQKAAIQTINLLVSQGVAKEKIKVVFVGVKKDVAEEFDALLGTLYTEGVAFDLNAAVFKDDIFDILMIEKRSLQSILKDKTNYKAKFLDATDEDEITKFSNLMVAQKAAPKVAKNLDTVFNALFA